MEKLEKYTLTFNDKKDQWDLQQDKTKKVIDSFDTKQEATAGGVLKDALGKNGGSVKVQKIDGKFQKEVTFPRSKDPKQSKG